MAKTREQRMAEIHAEAVQEFDDIIAQQGDEREICLSDRRFYSIAGAQWEGKLGEQFANKPRFEVNKIHLAVIRIFNEYRNNRITVNFIPKDGSNDDKLADTCNGLFRADEQDSCAEEAYDNAFEEAVGGGIGAWRLRACYEDEDDDENDHQRIRLEPIYDADSCVFFDNGSKRQDKSDATRCFVLTPMSKSQYIEEYGDDPDSWDKTIDQAEFDWVKGDDVYIAEYYRVEMRRELIRIFTSLDGEEVRHSEQDFINDPDLERMLLATGHQETGEKRVKKRRIRKYILSGGGVLEDCGIIAGKHIPIVVTFGKRWVIDGIERCMGHVRLSKDAQRLKNMQLSKLGEISALSTVSKPILAPEQVAGHETMWSEDNIKDYPYLLLNPLTDDNGNIVTAAPTAYTQPPAIPPAMAALLQITEQDMQDMLGNQQAGEEITSNISGKAVELIQTRLDMQTFIYMSNMSKAIKRSGEIWLSMAKELYVESGRKMKVVGQQMEIDSITLAEAAPGENGAVEYENDLGGANFDAVVDIGPSSSSKRSATVRALTGMMQITQDPETLQVLGSMAMMNMEGEGIEDVRDYFREKLIKMGVVKPTQQEAQDLMEAAQNARPDANETYLNAAAKEAEAKAIKAGADTELTLAKAEQSRAETVKTIADIDREGQETAIKTAQAIGAGLNQNFNQ